MTTPTQTPTAQTQTQSSTTETRTRRRYRRAVVVRMTDAEHQTLRAQARLARKSMSRYIVESALGREQHWIVMTPDDRRMMERVAAQIRRTGANVWTMMRALWLGGSIHIEELRDAQRELREIREVLTRWLS